jgi:hypothetical protein
VYTDIYNATATRAGWITEVSQISKTAPYLLQPQLTDMFKESDPTHTTGGGRVLRNAYRRALACQHMKGFHFHPGDERDDLVFFRCPVHGSMKDEWHVCDVVLQVENVTADELRRRDVEINPNAVRENSTISVVKGLRSSECDCVASGTGRCVHVAVVLWLVHLLPREEASTVVPAPPTSK